MNDDAPRRGTKPDEATACAICSGEDLSIQPPREEMLARLVGGDIFHASLPGSEASLICMVTSIEETIIRARRLIVPTDYAFDRTTGAERGGGNAMIDSIQPLPVDVHTQIMWLDRRNRLCWDLSQGGLSAEERHALLFVSQHYEEHQLLPPESDVRSPQGARGETAG